MYPFNTRDIVQVKPGVPTNLAKFVGQRGIILYHAGYIQGIPTAEAVLMGAKVKDSLKYRKTAQIDETVSGQIPIIPVKFLERLHGNGAELLNWGTVV